MKWIKFNKIQNYTPDKTVSFVEAFIACCAKCSYSNTCLQKDILWLRLTLLFVRKTGIEFVE